MMIEVPKSAMADVGKLETCRDLNGDGYFKCSACGAMLTADFCGEFSPEIHIIVGEGTEDRGYARVKDYEDIRYCPWCGAKVVR